MDQCHADPALREIFQDRYRDLLRVSRQWRNLQARKRNGVGYEPDEPVRPGQLTTACPACPRPGVNLPEGWQDDPEQ